MTEGKPITLANIKAKWFGTSLERKVMLMEVFKQHNEPKGNSAIDSSLIPFAFSEGGAEERKFDIGTSNSA